MCGPGLWFGGLPVGVREGRAAGVPLRVSDLGGLAEAVPDGSLGWRFAAGDSGALAAKLEELLLAPELLDAVEVPPAPRADVHFERLFEVYREVIAERERVG